MELSDYELSNIVGGKAGLGLYAAIGGLVTLIIGIIDGYLRPNKCNK